MSVQALCAFLRNFSLDRYARYTTPPFSTLRDSNDYEVGGGISKVDDIRKASFQFPLPTFFAESLQIDPDHSIMPRTTTEDSPKTTAHSIPIPRVPEHSAVSSPSLTDTTTPSPVDLKTPCSPLGCSLPCPATVLSQNSPHSESDPKLDSAEHHRCHYRTQEMLEAAHLKPWEARWKCREAEGGGLELDSKSQEDIADGFRMADTKRANVIIDAESEGESEQLSLSVSFERKGC